MTDKIPEALAVLDRAIYLAEDVTTVRGITFSYAITLPKELRKASSAFAELVAADKEYDEAKTFGSRPENLLTMDKRHESIMQCQRAHSRRKQALAAVEELK